MQKDDLTAAARLAVRDEVVRFLSRGFAVLGVGTLVAVVGGLAYIYNAFGDQAVLEAVTRTDRFLVERSSVVDGRIDRALERAEQLDTQTSELAGKAQFLGEDMEAARIEASRIKGELQAIRQDDVVSALADFLEVTSESNTGTNVLNRISELERANFRQVEIGRIVPTDAEYALFDNYRLSLDENGACLEPAVFRGIIDRTVTFDVPFEEPPTVQLALQNLDAYTPQSNFRISMQATDVSSTGFKASLYTWCDTRIYRVTATWKAVSK